MTIQTSIRTYRLRDNHFYDIFVENRSRRPIVMQHVYIEEDRCEERREIFNSVGRETPDFFFTLGMGQSK